MAQQVTISSVTGTTPINVYASDYYGNHRVFLGTITQSVPPNIIYDLPEEFSGVPIVNLILIDSLGCEITEEIICTT